MFKNQVFLRKTLFLMRRWIFARRESIENLVDFVIFLLAKMLFRISKKTYQEISLFSYLKIEDNIFVKCEKTSLIISKRLTFLIYISRLFISPCGGMVDTPVLGTGAFSVSVRLRPRAFFCDQILTLFLNILTLFLVFFLSFS